MKHDKCFRLNRSAMAIAQRDSRNVAIMVREGAIIKALNGPFDHGLMDVQYAGEVIMMFTNDLEHHNEVIEAQSA